MTIELTFVLCPAIARTNRESRASEEIKAIKVLKGTKRKCRNQGLKNINREKGH